MGSTEAIHKKNKRRQIFITASVILVVLIAIALAVAPGIIRNYINKNGTELTGRTLSVEKLKYNYFTSTLSISKAKMYEQNDTDIFVGFDSLLINLKPLRLLKNEFNVQQFKVVNLKAQVVQNDTIFNFTDLIEFFTTGVEAPVDTIVKEPYKLNLNQIEIKNGQLSYTDKQLDHTIAMENISFLIPQIYWGGAESTADVAFNIGDGGSISSSFDYNSKTHEYSGEADFKNLNLEIILPYIQQYMSFSDIEGLLDADIFFSGLVSDLNQFTLKGTAEVTDLVLDDQNNEKVLGVKHAAADLIAMKPLLYKAELGTVRLDQPYMNLVLIDSVFNLETLIVEQNEVQEVKQQEEESTPYDVFVNNFVIDSGLIDFSDQRLLEPFNYELSAVSVDMDSVSLSSDWLEINTTMKLNKRGNLEANLGVNPHDPFSHIELDYVLSDFQLPDVNIYSKHYMGLPILFGEMYYVNKTTIINRQLESSNELLIRNVEMGRKTGGLYDVPIKLALFILKDINGDVKLDIPVSGDLSDPKTNINKIVWETFKGFMFKIVASPFKALGNLLGAQPDEIEEITLVYSDTTLTGKQRRSLDLLLELEKMKPELAIEMQYLNDRKLERIDAASQIVQDSYKEKHNNNPLTHQKEYLKYLQAESGRDSLVIQDYERLLAPEAAKDSVIQYREQQRLRMVKEYLHMQNDSTTIRVLDYDPENVLNIGSRPRFVISYKLAEDLPDAESGN
ncbi:DUF748 domain-containing protein [Maribellus sediminis]|uniref:DUF748 domain-containing protein n=1 Tax=Maribellus sediminis TaxID=2696285 RepID=UPI001431D3AB|nr:DUF748 domain-containing protein [Maribellus sediminis]